MPLGAIAHGLFTLVVGAAERSHAPSQRSSAHTIQLLGYLFVICPLLLLATAAIVAGASWLIHLAGAGASYA